MFDNSIIFVVLDEYVNHYRRYSYQLVKFASFNYQFDPNVDSHAFKVELHEFIICLRHLTLEPIILSGNIATLKLKLLVDTKAPLN